MLQEMVSVVLEPALCWYLGSTSRSHSVLQEVDSRTMLSQAESLAGLVEQGGGPEVVPYLATLRQGLQDSAVEARNFAAQQRADVERTKRTSAQVHSRFKQQ